MRVFHSHARLYSPSRTLTRVLWQDTKSIILPVAGNIACSFNFCNIGYAVQLMRLEHPVPRWAAPAFASSCLCGAVLGQLLLGWFGDRFGRRPAMVITTGLIVFGALGSAVMTTGYGNWIWQSLVVWRFILGIGLGGTYPLTAVMAGEASDDRGLGRTRRVALAIAVQIVGNILAPVLLFVLLCLLGTDRVTREPWATELGWRFLLGIGALPGIVALKEIVVDSGTEAESNEYLDARASGGIGRLREIWAVMFDSSSDSKYRTRLIGCAAGWAAFDMCFFGIVIFLPHVIHDLIDRNDEAMGYLMLNALVSTAINCIAIPAALLSFRLVGDDGFGRKNLQSFSFILICVAYAVLAFFFNSLRAIEATTAIVLLFAALFFCLNFGAGMTTYMLPQESFPVEVRASLNGVAAAAGKIGAILGASAFAPSARILGLGNTFACCAFTACVGLGVTILFVPDMRKVPACRRPVLGAPAHLLLANLLARLHAHEVEWCWCLALADS